MSLFCMNLTFSILFIAYENAINYFLQAAFFILINVYVPFMAIRKAST